MSVRARLVLTLSALTALLAVPTAYGVLRLRQVRDIALGLQGRDAVASLAVGRLEAALGRLDWSERSYIAVPGKSARTDMYAALDSAHAALQDLDVAGLDSLTRQTAALVSVLGASAARAEALIRARRFSDATEEFQEVKPLFASARSSLGPVASAIDRRGADAADRARRISAAAVRATVAALLAALALALVVGIWLTGSLTGPLRRIGSAMRRVARGDFHDPDDLPYARADELGDLSRSFQSMTRQLAELARLRAEFVSMATHELKTPLNVITGYGEMLEAGEYGALEDPQECAVQRIREQAETLDRLVTQLLDVSRIEAGAFTVEMEPMAVGRLLDDLERSFEALAAQRGVRFCVQADSSVPDSIDGDIDRLRNEVLGNLLANAFKFTPRGGSIRLRARGGREVVAFEVSDTGCGIEPDHLPHVFEKYYQPDRASRALGAGLGLAIAREVVLVHGGSIDVTSLPGEGTCFVVTLPLHQPAPEAARVSLPSAGRSEGARVSSEPEEDGEAGHTSEAGRTDPVGASSAVSVQRAS